MFDAAGLPIHFTLARTTDAAAEPLTAAELKTALRVDSSAEDTLIEAYIKAARHAVEAATGRALVNTTYTMTMDSAPASGAAILLPVSPVSSVTSINSTNTADAESVLASTVYRLDTSSVPARIVLRDGQAWPTGLRPENALRIVFVAGYGATAASITDVGLIHAVRMLATHWFEQREPVVVGQGAQEVPMAFRMLTDPMRVPWL